MANIKHLTRAFGALLVLASGAIPVWAQDAALWSGPDNAFSVIIPEGWTEVADPMAPEGYLLIIGAPRMRTDPDKYFRECVVHHRPMPDLPPTTQAKFNAVSANRPQNLITDQPLLTYQAEDIDGVYVTTASWASADKKMWFGNASFGLVTDGAVVLYTIDCGANGGEGVGEDGVAMLKFMQSISFSR